MHYLKNDISEFEFEVYKSSNICQKVVLITGCHLH